ncbi:murein biosynthesis integral membrane protein MurJ [Candidatus Collierbacteria bacterium]|nr:murein biosynthesis integral membrane protein MurJ [Candidatus Collierbacteria bacterium]
MVKYLLHNSKNLFNHQHKSILSAAFVIGASYLGSAFLGLIRNRLLAARFFGGMERDLDVYFAAFVIPDTIFQLLIVGAVSVAFIPIYQSYSLKSQDKANELANAALTTIGLSLIFLTLLLVIFAEPVAGLLAHYPPDQLKLMANLIRLMSLAQVLFAVSAFLTGILQAHRRFLIPAIAPLLYNLGTILGIYFLSSSLGIYSAALGVVFGALLHVLIQIPLARYLGFTPKPLLKPNHPGVVSMLKLMPPRTLALAVDQIERWVAVNLTSLLFAGSLSLFSFARQLYVLPISLFGISLSQASFPVLAEEANGHKEKFIATLRKSILQIFFFALPASILILVLRIPLVRLAFGAKTFPWIATLLTGKTLAFLSLTIAPQAVTHLLTRAFHAYKNTKTPLLVGLISMFVFTLVAYFTSKFWGIVGIAVSISLANLIDFSLLYLLLSRQLGNLGLSKPLAKMLLASSITGLALWLPLRLLDRFVFDTTHTLPLIALTISVTLIGFGVYLFFSYLFRVAELHEVLNLFKKLGNWQKVLVKSDEVIEPTP